ncbi:MAG TPA: DsbA family protein [Candidatus Binatia bacterium]|jgi:2-hydroxychromene-2-carboxylate isomerase
MPTDDPSLEEVKLYFDYKSPFAFLASGPAFELDGRFRVRLRWIPYQLRIKGKGERSQNSEWKAKYSYLDARRWAAQRGLVIKGPRKVYDTEPALIGAVYALRAGCFRRYTEEAYGRFFRRELELDDPAAIGALLGECGGSPADYERFRVGDGATDYARCVAEAEADHVFGVPLFLFRGEPFWGHDRMPLLESRLRESGLAR